MRNGRRRCRPPAATGSLVGKRDRDHHENRQEQEGEQHQPDDGLSRRLRIARRFMSSLPRRLRASCGLRMPPGEQQAHDDQQHRRKRRGEIPAHRCWMICTEMYSATISGTAGAEQGRGDQESQRKDEDEQRGDRDAGQRSAAARPAQNTVIGRAPSERAACTMRRSMSGEVGVEQQHRERHHVVHHADRHADAIVDELRGVR